jgi:1,4-alpha-glucan branching enzyme
MERTTDMASYLFHQGTNYFAYDYMGAHKTERGYVFRVWAPNADHVLLTGDFNAWSESIPMQRITEGGIWETEVTDGSVKAGARYKYKIYGCGQVHYKADPYAFRSELRPGTASVVYGCKPFKWSDKSFLNKRGKYNHFQSPMNIYEIHPGSWKTHDDGSFLSYQSSDS